MGRLVWVRSDAYQKSPNKFECKVSIGEEVITYRLTPQSIDPPKSSSLVKWIADQRYPYIAEASKTQYGVKYQLLTDHTDYLIEMARAQTEKTDAIPSMVQVPQMQVKGREYMSMPMFSRRLDDGRIEPTVLFRRAPDQEDPVVFSRYLLNKIANFRLKRQQQAKEKAEIQLLLNYLTGLLEPNSVIDYNQLAQLHASETLICWLRMAQLNNALLMVLPQLIEIALKAKDWRRFHHRVSESIANLP
ncbi:hypothetical protein [Thiomicrospira microaerophila]|uniref:hypothetical protein n=1 Tax=Thiomicrospira microaerophila TaxID=406020 RepID=UPI0005C9A3A6|nr:hypothetical protein [Thiomicrospira microaerophila]